MPNPWGTAISLAAARTIVVRALAHARSSDFPSDPRHRRPGLRADPGAADPT